MVGYAADTVAARDSSATNNSESENSFKVLDDKVNLICKKLEIMQASGSNPSNNIVINSYSSGSQQSRQTSFTQTEETHQRPHSVQQAHSEQEQHDQEYVGTPLDVSQAQNTL